MHSRTPQVHSIKDIALGEGGKVAEDTADQVPPATATVEQLLGFSQPPWPREIPVDSFPPEEADPIESPSPNEADVHEGAEAEGPEADRPPEEPPAAPPRVEQLLTLKDVKDLEYGFGAVDGPKISACEALDRPLHHEANPSCWDHNHSLQSSD